ncbi:MAG: phosphate acyltransferase PlsX [Cytophagales bacterium]
MRIAIDAMGGDNAPLAVIKGAIAARSELSDEIKMVLLGDQKIIEETIVANGGRLSDFEIVDAPEVIGMGEHPTKSIAQKPKSSILIGYKLLASKQVDVLCSAGNTGAMLVGAMFTVKAIEGIIRPGIAGFIPKLTGKYGILLDVGANAECKPDVLAQFAEMGSLYASYIFGNDKPRVGLMSLGEEEEKGTLVTQAAHQLIKLNPRINFIGNVEGRDVFLDKADVIICDGFIGNVILKLSESMYPILKERNFTDDFIELFDWRNVGGSPILGINGNVVIGHGSSTDYAIKNMIKLSKELVDSEITKKLKQAYS